MKRRSLLAALPALPLAIVAAPARAEHPNDTVRRLGRQIMEALRDPRFIGFDRITITPEQVGYSENDADTRIAYAIHDIGLAFKEKYPDWRLQVLNDAQRVIRTKGGVDYDAEINRHAVLIFVGDESRYEQHAGWHVNHRSI